MKLASSILGSFTTERYFNEKNKNLLKYNNLLLGYWAIRKKFAFQLLCDDELLEIPIT